MSMNKSAMPYQSYGENLNIPSPSPNAGLYVGEPFQKNAPWANHPVTPDASYMIHHNLRSANPPPGALYQYPSGNRPGNNVAIMHGVQKDNSHYNLLLIKDSDKNEPCDCYKCRMSKYAYL